MFSASFDGTDVIAAKGLLDRGPRIIEKLVVTMNVQARRLQSHIQVDKLSGQVLKPRSGKLRGSIRVIDAAVSNATIFAEVLGGGGLAPYGEVHEYGGKAPYVIVPKNRKALRFMMNGKIVFARKVIHPPLPERSFMRSGLDDMRAGITTSLQTTLDQEGKT